MNGTLVPVYVTPKGFDHAEHDVQGVALGGGKFNLRCVEHNENIGIFEEDNR